MTSRSLLVVTLVLAGCAATPTYTHPEMTSAKIPALEPLTRGLLDCAQPSNVPLCKWILTRETRLKLTIENHNALISLHNEILER